MAPSFGQGAWQGGAAEEPITILESDVEIDCSPERKQKPAENDSDPQTRVTTRALNLKKVIRWDLDATLQLLDSMKAYIIKHEVLSMGAHMDRWAEVAVSVENPHGMEPDVFTRSCYTRYQSLTRVINRSVKRYWNKPMIHTVDDSVRQSRKEYVQLCHRYTEIERLRLQSRNDSCRL